MFLEKQFFASAERLSKSSGKKKWCDDYNGELAAAKWKPYLSYLVCQHGLDDCCQRFCFNVVLIHCPRQFCLGWFFLSCSVMEMHSLAKIGEGTSLVVVVYVQKCSRWKRKRERDCLVLCFVCCWIYSILVFLLFCFKILIVVTDLSCVFHVIKVMLGI